MTGLFIVGAMIVLSGRSGRPQPIWEVLHRGYALQHTPSYILETPDQWEPQALDMDLHRLYCLHDRNPGNPTEEGTSSMQGWPHRQEPNGGFCDIADMGSNRKNFPRGEFGC